MVNSDVVAMNTPNLGLMNKGFGNIACSYIFIKAEILRLLEFLGIEWSLLQINECADIIAKQYYGLHIAEIKHFLLRAKTQHYNKNSFARLTPNIFLGWLNEYWEESLYTKGQISEGRAKRIAFEAKNNISTKGLTYEEKIQQKKYWNEISKLTEELTGWQEDITEERQAIKDEELAKKKDILFNQLVNSGYDANKLTEQKNASK